MIPSHGIPAHPGKIPKEGFLDEMGVSQVEVAGHIGVPVQRNNEMVRGKRGVTSNTAWRLAQALDTTPELAALSANMDAPDIATKFAIVASGTFAYGMGRIYGIYRDLNPRSTRKVRVFRTMPEALDGIGER